MSSVYARFGRAKESNLACREIDPSAALYRRVIVEIASLRFVYTVPVCTVVESP